MIFFLVLTLHCIASTIERLHTFSWIFQWHSKFQINRNCSINEKAWNYTWLIDVCGWNNLHILLIYSNYLEFYNGPSFCLKEYFDYAAGIGSMIHFFIKRMDKIKWIIFHTQIFTVVELAFVCVCSNSLWFSRDVNKIEQKCITVNLYGVIFRMIEALCVYLHYSYHFWITIFPKLIVGPP